MGTPCVIRLVLDSLDHVGERDPLLGDEIPAGRGAHAARTLVHGNQHPTKIVGTRQPAHSRALAARDRPHILRTLVVIASLDFPIELRKLMHTTKQHKSIGYPHLQHSAVNC